MKQKQWKCQWKFPISSLNYRFLFLTFSLMNHYHVLLVTDTQLYTLPCRLVGWLVCWLVHRSVTFLNFRQFLHYCSCSIVHDCLAMYLTLFFFSICPHLCTTAFFSFLRFRFHLSRGCHLFFYLSFSQMDSIGCNSSAFARVSVVHVAFSLSHAFIFHIVISFS